MSAVIFDSTIAKKVGVNAAIIYERIRYFCQDAHAKRDIYKYHDGAYWTYNSRTGWKNSLPFLTDEQIKLAIKKLKESALIKIGNYNKSKWDKTNWYTILDGGKDLDWVPAPDPYCYKTQEPAREEPVAWVLKPNQLVCDNPTIPNESSNESSNVVVEKQKKMTTTNNVNNLYNSTRDFENRFSKDFKEIQDFLIKTEMPGLKKLSKKFYEYYKTLENLQIDYNNIAENLIAKQNYDFSDINQKRSFANTIAKILAKTVQND